MLFLSLIVADSLQHLALTFTCALSSVNVSDVDVEILPRKTTGIHLARGSVTSPSALCTAQGFLIQVGDFAINFTVRRVLSIDRARC